MLTPRLALQSLRNRLLATTLTVLSIAFSVALLVGIENIRNGLRESFTGTVSGVDLIVGPRSSSVQLLLYSVFGMGSPTGNISWETYTHFRDHPAVAWTIPYSLGDNHRGFRVIGTTDAFYEHFRYREGRTIAFQEGSPAVTDHDVVVGAEVADRLEYALGDEIVVTHGMGAAGIMDHDEAPFRITGVLERTGTPVDRALYVTLAGIEAMHAGWEGGVPPMPSFAPPPDEAGGEAVDETADEGTAAPGVQPAGPAPASVEPAQITTFFVGTPTRFEMLGLQREINDFQQEPLTALLPGIALAEMWRTVGYAEDGLRIVSFFVVIVGLLGMLVSLYTALDARRREMSIFRAIGAGPGRIVSLLVVESGFLAAAGALLGVLLVYGGIWVSQGAVEERFGLLIPIRPLGTLELGYLGAVVLAGFIIGLVPAIKAYRTTLTDGLSPRS
jgi:putative ABC transport system permease protein